MGILALVIMATDAAAQAGARYDPDGDGKVTMVEFRAARTEQIMRLDRDKDGRVTRVETKTIEGAARTFGGKAAVGRIGELWSLGDANRDGAITREEATGIADRRFPHYDLNNDGWLSPKELVAVGRGTPGANQTSRRSVGY